MSNFNNNAYQSLVADLIGDTFYKDTSVSGRISFVRKYAEVVMPLERNTGWMDKLGDRIASRINSVSSSGAGINLTVKLGEDNIFDKFLEYVNQKGFESNGEVVYA